MAQKTRVGWVVTTLKGNKVFKPKLFGSETHPLQEIPKKVEGKQPFIPAGSVLGGWLLRRKKSNC